MARISKLKVLLSWAILGMIVLLSTPIYASNEAMLELLKLLRDKGSITTSEYELLKNTAEADEEKIEESVSEIKQDVEENISVATTAMDNSGWASKIKLKGDIRLRYQTQNNEPGDDRSRGRFRYRLGVIAQPTSGWEVGSGLASGGSDLRSNNQSFTGTFSTKAINLDYAYAQYIINDNLKVIGGKFKHASYLYAPSDLMWDSDINPEGFSAKFTHNSELGTTFANSGIWVLSESSSGDDDPYMIYAQLGQNFGSDNLLGRVAGTYYSFEDITALGAIATDGSNSDFNFGGIYSLSGEIGLNSLFNSNIKASIFADWVSNSDSVTDEDNGYLVGVKASNGPWAIRYSYADLEQNAWPDILPDSDRFDGLTGIQGHEIGFSYKILKNVSLDLDYYAVESDVSFEDQDLLQMDVSVKF